MAFEALLAVRLGNRKLKSQNHVFSPMPLSTITKTQYLSGLQCHKKLWREVHTKEAVPPPSESTLRLYDIGQEIEQRARDPYPNGVLIDGNTRSAVISQTKTAIKNNTPIIFQAGFEFSKVYVRVDILRLNVDRSWDLVEVKSGTEIKPHHLDDVAIQFFALAGCGLKIKKIAIQHVNNKCVFPDLSDLLIEVDVTETILAMQADLRNQVQELRTVLPGIEPSVQIGENCTKPYECEFKDDCWSFVPERSIFEINGLQWQKKEELIALDVFAIADIPVDFILSEKKSELVAMLKAGVPVIDARSIAKELRTLKFPLYFFDFETDSPAIPRFEGASPYHQFPYQFSCHVMQRGGQLTHQEYLHTDTSEPRRIVAERMLNVLGTSGSIIAYNANFETTVIRSLAKMYPDLEANLLALVPRFFDQLIIFKKHYFHPDFGGSNSIKSVLPVIVPGLSYDALDHVHDGGEAGLIWNKAILETDEGIRQTYFNSLKDYCKLDTLAMVEIHKILMQIIS